jgi:hypothetical protein
MPVGHLRPGRGPTVAVAVRIMNLPSNSYFFPAVGVNASPVTGTAVADDVGKSDAKITYVHGSAPPPACEWELIAPVSFASISAFVMSAFACAFDGAWAATTCAWMFAFSGS